VGGRAGRATAEYGGFIDPDKPVVEPLDTVLPSSWSSRESTSGAMEIRVVRLDRASYTSEYSSSSLSSSSITWRTGIYFVIH